MNILMVHIGTAEDALNEFIEVWQTGKPAQAKILKRNYKNVHTDIQTLLELGLVTDVTQYLEKRL